MRCELDLKVQGCIKFPRRKGESNIISPIILRLLGRTSIGERVRGRKFLGRKSISKKRNGRGEEYKVVGNFIHPCKADID